MPRRLSPVPATTQGRCGWRWGLTGKLRSSRSCGLGYRTGHGDPVRTRRSNRRRRRASARSARAGRARHRRSWRYLRTVHPHRRQRARRRGQAHRSDRRSILHVYAVANCAAVVDRVENMLTGGVDDFDQVINVNLRGAWLLIRAAGKAMIAACNAGAMVTVSSINALRPGRSTTRHPRLASKD